MAEAICKAIAGRNVIVFVYQGAARTVEPHCHGTHQDTGSEIMRGWQIYGPRDSGKPAWMMYDVADMEDILVTAETFDRNWPTHNGEDEHVSGVHCCV